MIGNGKTISYKYNDSGIRTQKTVNNITTSYHLVGDKVTYEDNGTDKIYYTYDSSDNLVSMNLNGVEYYYIRNAQGDIIGLFDKDGAKVASYTYDSWGKLISIKDGNGADITNNTTSVGYKNPYRYRGYRYDTETGLYYLNSRYYNPEWGRFINADGYGGKIGDLLSHNLFAYCKNNPVNLMDPDGNFGFLAALGGIAGGSAIIAAATVAIGAVAVVATVILVATAVTEAVNHYQAAQLMSNASSNSSGNESASSSGGGSGGSPSDPNGNKPKGFNSFRQLKRNIGSAGVGKAWHHIVEQTPANIAKFGAPMIHNINNIMKLDHGKGSIHAKISGFYSSIQPFTNGQTVRQWLRTKDFSEQYDFGMKIIKIFQDK